MCPPVVLELLLVLDQPSPGVFELRVEEQVGALRLDLAILQVLRR